MNSLISTSSRFLENFFKDFPAGFSIRPLHGDSLLSPSQIKINVQDQGSDFVVSAEMPGVKKEDIKVSVEGNGVTLSAEVNQEDSQTTEGKMVYSERYMGAVSRSFSLPCEVDETKARAKYQEGVITLTLPKRNDAKSKQIPID